jgi:glutaredoxin 1
MASNQLTRSGTALKSTCKPCLKGDVAATVQSLVVAWSSFVVALDQTLYHYLAKKSMKITIYGKEDCSYCKRAVELSKQLIERGCADSYTYDIVEEGSTRRHSVLFGPTGPNRSADLVDGVAIGGIRNWPHSPNALSHKGPV